MIFDGFLFLLDINILEIFCQIIIHVNDDMPSIEL